MRTGLRFLLVLVPLFSLAALAPGCAMPCEEGAACDCPRGVRGAQVCADNGSLDRCDCSGGGGGGSQDGGTTDSGSTCPALMDCTGRECGPDPVCFLSCGVCGGGTSCSNAGQCIEACTSAADCDTAQICKSGACQPFDPGALCNDDTDCPRDHTCNPLVQECQGCINDASCISSAAGPKCDVADDGQGPGVGYCHVECSTDAECTGSLVCDTAKGGLCVPGCASNADCAGGLVCKGGSCSACAADADCDGTKVCDPRSKLCVEPAVCSDAGCQGSFGPEYYCDGTTNSCLRGCDDAANPCPAAQVCNATTHQCEGGGGGCDCAALACDPATQICDSVACACVAQGGGGGGGGNGDPCLQDSDCQAGLACQGAFPQQGIQGTCGGGGGTCDMSTGCFCAPPLTCFITGDPIMDQFACLTGAAGTCQ